MEQRQSEDRGSGQAWLDQRVQEIPSSSTGLNVEFRRFTQDLPWRWSGKLTGIRAQIRAGIRRPLLASAGSGPCGYPRASLLGLEIRPKPSLLPQALSQHLMVTKCKTDFRQARHQHVDACTDIAVGKGLCALDSHMCSLQIDNLAGRSFEFTEKGI